MARPVRTTEFSHFRRTLKCPNGHKRSIRFREGVGDVLQDLSIRDRILLENPAARSESQWSSMRRIGRLRSVNHELFGGITIERFRTDSEIECLLCNMRWLIFTQEGADQIVADHGPQRRFTTPLGTDTHRLDRSGSVVDTTEKLVVEKKLTVRSECVWERTTTRTHGATGSAKAAKGPLSLSVEVQSRVERKMRETFTNSKQEESNWSRTIDVPIPAGHVAIVDIAWKQVWEESDFEVHLADGQTIIVPFRRTVDLAFDDAVRHE